MATTSFLHAASAKIVADKLRDDRASFISDGRRSSEESRDVPAGALRLLLVEEEDAGTNDFAGVGSLARSLAMDAAYSLVSGSVAPCRGCREDAGGTNADGDRLASERAACRCCRVALLVPGGVEKPKKRRRRNGNGSKFIGDTGRVAFPLSCSSDRMIGGEKWDPTLLGQIQMKYVDSLSEVKRYLAYAPSLPEKMQPSDGIFLLGLGELIPRQSSYGMEFTNILSILSDTANMLDDNRGDLLKLNVGAQNVVRGGISTIVTIDEFTCSSIPPKVARHHHQWMDFVASIVAARGDAAIFDGEDAATSYSEWDLVFKNTGVLEPFPSILGESEERESSFGFKVNLRFNESERHSKGAMPEISWRV